MKATLATVAIAITVIVVLVLAACASRKEAPDPAAVQRSGPGFSDPKMLFYK